MGELGVSTGGFTQDGNTYPAADGDSVNLGQLARTSSADEVRDQSSSQQESTLSKDVHEATTNDVDLEKAGEFAGVPTMSDEEAGHSDKINKKMSPPALQDQTNLLPTKQVIVVFAGLSCALFCESFADHLIKSPFIDALTSCQRLAS